MRRLAIILLAAGCLADPVAESKTDNVEIRVQRLFTHDGCTVYRFNDSGVRYYARCEGTASTEWTEHCGKGCEREEQIHTVDGAAKPPARSAPKDSSGDSR